MRCFPALKYAADAARKTAESAVEDDGREKWQVHTEFSGDRRHASVTAEYDDEPDERYDWFVVEK